MTIVLNLETRLKCNVYVFLHIMIFKLYGNFIFYILSLTLLINSSKFKVKPIILS